MFVVKNFKLDNLCKIYVIKTVSLKIFIFYEMFYIYIIWDFKSNQILIFTNLS